MAKAKRGNPFPLGATVEPGGGVNFALYSRHAHQVELCVFDHVDDTKPATVYKLDARRHRTDDYWHAFIKQAGPGMTYGYRVLGPNDPQTGLRFDPDKVLLDPYGRSVVVPRAYRREAAIRPGPNDAEAMKNVVVDVSEYDWEGDEPLRRPFSETVIYELHVRGFTRHPSSGVKKRSKSGRRNNRRGSFAGLIEKIPYLVDLGVTAVELLPVFQFDRQHAPEGLSDYWGYGPVSFFAPHAGYSWRRDPLGPLDEFRDMVKALHRAGIEVILDVVYNHTGEGGDGGPTISFRGLDNATYYMLENGGSRYANYSGTGNTLNANQPIVRRLILDSLRYWVEQMHVDGFRFDLASILSRDQSGRPVPNPPVLLDIETDPVLAGTKLIAEAWDAAGLYQVGDFVGDSWKEWNGKFRDDVRSFWRGDKGSVPGIAERIMGSPALYGGGKREPERSVNFVTCHDGHTLNDLVTFSRKHNDANLEGGRDGSDDNRGWNCGVEGPTDHPRIEALRNRQVKNFLALTLLSVGTPMLLMGDEMRRTQHGNNNAWSQDNELSWLDWSLLEEHGDVHRFVKELIAVRQHFDSVRIDSGLTLGELIRQAKIRLHGTRMEAPDLSHDSHTLAVSAVNRSNGLRMHFLLNGFTEPLTFELPKLPDGVEPWRRVVDTSLTSPEDVTDPAHAPFVIGDGYPTPQKTVVVLFASAAGN
ncbi:MAG: glycogen debranching protein GlgX [Acidimicrobiia bacterium]|nr:glycogen debranching protein GlgX [Acidimicrobiia bacterium]NNL96607.1 glycogen debranching protein GlgX [Acidimicrobiia bacterium]RZV42980.1 MAG: glycogen debranching enzyme GlgX [Acidimicrobiia bacterium]